MDGRDGSQACRTPWRAQTCAQQGVRQAWRCSRPDKRPESGRLACNQAEHDIVSTYPVVNKNRRLIISSTLKYIYPNVTFIMCPGPCILVSVQRMRNAVVKRQTFVWQCSLIHCKIAWWMSDKHQKCLEDWHISRTLSAGLYPRQA